VILNRFKSSRAAAVRHRNVLNLSRQVVTDIDSEHSGYLHVCWVGIDALACIIDSSIAI
jgi:hypothetical protein